MSIEQNFIPIVTTFTVTSHDLPLEECMNDDVKLSKAFLNYREKIGYKSLPIMEDSNFTAEAFGCKLGFREREVYVLDPLTFYSKEELENYQVPKIKDCNRIQLILNAVRNISKIASEEEPVIVNTTAPFTSAGKILGIENLLLKLIDEPEQVKHFLKKITEFILQFTKALIEEGADILFVADPVASTEIISPQMFTEFAFPEIKALIAHINQPTILHICGNVYPILTKMVETKATILSVDQHVDLKKVREIVGKEVFLGGNIDPSEVLFKQTPEKVAQVAWKCYQDGGTDQFILMPGCTILPETPVENIWAMMKVAKEATARKG